MSQAFNYFPICQIGKGTWIGEESFFLDVQHLNYSIKTLTTVRVLEIGIIDFQDKMP